MRLTFIGIHVCVSHEQEDKIWPRESIKEVKCRDHCQRLLKCKVPGPYRHVKSS